MKKKQLSYYQKIKQSSESLRLFRWLKFYFWSFNSFLTSEIKRFISLEELPLPFSYPIRLDRKSLVQTIIIKVILKGLPEHLTIS